jgi:hypothetical protein
MKLITKDENKKRIVIKSISSLTACIFQGRINHNTILYNAEEKNSLVANKSDDFILAFKLFNLMKKESHIDPVEIVTKSKFWDYYEFRKQTFRNNKQIHFYQDIDSLRVESVMRYHNGWKNGATFSIEYEIKDDPKIYTMSQHTGIKHKSKKLDEIKKAYMVVSKNSFNSRLQKYMKCIENNGYFEYGNTQFFENGIIKQKNKEFDLNDKSNGKIYFRDPKERINHYPSTSELIFAFSNKLFSKKIHVIIYWDRDILFYLLEKYFQLIF